jgi:hypothetical protein
VLAWRPELLTLPGVDTATARVVVTAGGAPTLSR